MECTDGKDIITPWRDLKGRGGGGEGVAWPVLPQGCVPGSGRPSNHKLIEAGPRAAKLQARGGEVVLDARLLCFQSEHRTRLRTWDRIAPTVDLGPRPSLTKLPGLVHSNEDCADGEDLGLGPRTRIK